MMKRFITPGLVLVLLISHVYGQENFQPGYVVTIAGDTVQGFVNDLDWETNPGRVGFKKIQDAAQEYFGALDIKAFHVSGEHYVGAIVEVEQSSMAISELSKEPSFKIIQDTVFLRQLFHGAKPLYYYSYGQKDLLYIQGNSGYELLLYKKYINQKGLVVENKRFIGQLTFYLADCTTLESKLRLVKYSRGGLQDLFLSYYRCTKADYSFFTEMRKKQLKVASEFGVLAGLTFSSIIFRGDYFDVDDGSYDPSINFSGGVFWNVFARNQFTWKLVNELVYSSYRFNGSADGFNSSYPSHSDLTISTSHLQLNSIARYTFFPMGQFSWFGNVGGTVGGVLSREGRRVNLTNQVRTVRDDFFDESYVTAGYLLGLGVQHQHFSTELRYNRKLGPYGPDFSTVLSSVSLLVGYRF